MISEIVGGGETREVDEVPDGLYSGFHRQIFQNVAVQDPRHNSGHYMVMVCLRFAFPRDHSYYLGSRIRLPLCPPVRQTRTQANNIFAEFRRAVSKQKKKARHHNSWVS